MGVTVAADAFSKPKGCPMSQRRQFSFIPCADRLLVIDLDPPTAGQPSNGRVRIFIEESCAVLEAPDIEAARAAFTIQAVQSAEQATPIRARAAKGRG
jgi:hypothetical protein